MAAFWLPGAVTKFRFGNEAENDGELQADTKVWDKDGATFLLHTMAQFWNPYSAGTAGTPAAPEPSGQPSEPGPPGS